MRATRAKVVDEGDTMLFSTTQLTGNRLYAGEGEAVRIYTPRMYGSSYGLFVYAADEENVRTLYPWHTVLWVEESA